MNSFSVVAFAACLAVANAGWFQHSPSAHILQGPSSKTTLVGPAGSVISAVAPGGHIVLEEHPGYVAHATPVVAHSAHVVAHLTQVVAHSAHVLAHPAPVVAHHAQVVAHAAPATVVTHSSAYEHDIAVVAGPSGIISTGHDLHAAPVVAHAAPLLAHFGVIYAHGAHDIHGHEGQYVHDHSEALYDDGSYKPHLYHH